MEVFELNDGTKLPVLCFGPGMFTRGLPPLSNSLKGKVMNRIWLMRKECEYLKAIQSAFEQGARFIDYSASYGREDLVAKAMKTAGLRRDDCILTTRVSNISQFKSTVRDSVLNSIKRFGTDYIDVLMFHWPVTDHYVDTWREMINLKKDGIARTIGVANCHQHHIDTLIEETGIVPSINQIEVHPLFTQKNLLDYCQKKGIVVEAYTPLARMDERMVRLPRLKEISKKYNKTISQVVLRWHIQNGIIPVFRSLNASRQKENFDIFDFSLSHDDMLSIDSININSRLRYDPDNCDFSIL